MISKICKTCGKEFEVKRYRKYTASSCSIRCAKIGTIPWNKGLEGLFVGDKNPFYGKKHTLETRKKMSEMKIGEKHNFYGRQMPQETRDRIGLANSVSLKGKKQSLETRKKRAENNLGAKSHFWRGGITKVQEHARGVMEYSIWRKSVFERDNYTCQKCGVRSGSGCKVILNADHIKQFALILLENSIKSIDEARSCKELWDISNGRTLCEECHKSTDTYRKRLSGYVSNNLLTV